MAVPAPHAYIVMLSVALFFALALAVSRYIVLPRPHGGMRSRPKSYLIADIFYYSAIISQVSMCSMLLYRTASEIRFRNEVIHMAGDSPLSPNDITKAVFEKMTEPVMLIILFVSGCCYYSSLCLIRGAFLAFYWSLYTHAGISTRWIKVTIVMTLILTAVTFAMGLGWCRPITRNWSNDYEDYNKCTVVYSLTVRVTATAINVGTDLAIILLPIALISRLTLGPRETAALVFVYSIGLVVVIACLTSVVNLKYSLEKPNSLESIRAIEMWSVIESTAAIFAFSLPAFKKYILRKLGTNPADRVRAMRMVEDPEQQPQEGANEQGEGGDQLQAALGVVEHGQKDVNLGGSGTGNLSIDPPSTTQEGGVWNKVFGGQKKGNTTKRKGNNGFPSFVRGSLVGGAGWIGPKLGDLSLSGGSTMDNSRNRRRRTLDDIELTSFDDYEESRISDTGHGDQNDRGHGNMEVEREREGDSGEVWNQGSSINILGVSEQRPNSEESTGGGAEWEVGGTNRA